MTKIKLGSEVCDKITGFKGIAIGIAIYITGCDQYLVQPPCEKTSKKPTGQWCDEGRLEVLETHVVMEKDVQGDEDGADISAPIK